jgi:RNA polymerase sigma factor (sigma-70 family)
LGGFRGGSSFRTWLTRIGINQCKDELHRRRRRAWVPLEVIEAEGRRLPGGLVHFPEQVLPETRRIPPEAFKRLSPGERKVLEWVGENPKADYSAIGGQLGWTVDSVKGRLKRAREKVRDYLRRHGEEE